MRYLFLVTRNLPPLRGGMERLNAHMAGELSDSYKVSVYGPKGASPGLHAGVTLRTSPVGGVAAFLLWALLVVPVAAIRQRPAWILGGSGLVAPVVWFASLVSRAKSALYLHGLDIVVANRAYQRLWLPMIRRADRCVVNSRNTARLAVDAGVSASRVAIVCPGVELPAPVDAARGIGFRARHGLGAAPILLSVGRLTARKGLAEFVESGLPGVLVQRPDTMLVVIGDDAGDALASRAGAGRERVLATAQRLGLADHIRFLGPVDEDELRAAYEASDVHVFPVRELVGDIEGFGMVAIESAAHGLPSVAFASGGVPDAIAEGVSGYLVAPGDYAGFARAILDALAAGRSSFSENSRAFAAGFAWPRFGERLRNIMDMGRRA